MLRFGNPTLRDCYVVVSRPDQKIRRLRAGDIVSSFVSTFAPSGRGQSLLAPSRGAGELSWPKADLRPVLRRDTAPGQGLFRKKGLSNLALAGGVAERLRHSWVITLRTRIRFS